MSQLKRVHVKLRPDMGAAEVEAFLTYFATQRQVSSSTQNQALSPLKSPPKLLMLP